MHLCQRLLASQGRDYGNGRSAKMLILVDMISPYEGQGGYAVGPSARPRASLRADEILAADFFATLSLCLRKMASAFCSGTGTTIPIIFNSAIERLIAA
jgi:hypothetical protein